MIRKACVLLAFALLARPVEAKPHPKLKKVFTAIYIIGLPTAMATWNTIEVAHCRNRAGIERCETRYGAWKGVQLAEHVAADLIFPIITYKIKHIEEANHLTRTWPFIPGGSAIASAFMATDQRFKQREAPTHCSDGKRFNGFGCERD